MSAGSHIEIGQNRLALTGVGQADVMTWVKGHFPEVEPLLQKLHPFRGNGSVVPYQAAVLYYLAKSYNFGGARFLEIGTYNGYTTALLAEAAPAAEILSIGPLPWEYDHAKENLTGYPGIKLVCSTSQDYYALYAGPPFCFVFVDGDHKRIYEDLAWWRFVEPGGLMIFHDYSPNGSIRPCPPVYRCMEKLREKREPDILIVDSDLIGMIGFRKRAGEDVFGVSK
jgi:predicted O-methyltransferase YrrM